MGKLDFHDDKTKKKKFLSLEKIFGVFGFWILVYLVQGLVPAERPKLQMLSGILPPINVSYLHDEKTESRMHPENMIISKR